MIEVWKDIPNWDGVYQVSNLGRVRSRDRVTVGVNGRIYKFKGRILKQSINSDGYLVLLLKYGRGTQKMARVHRLVMETFVPNTYSKETVNHIDLNKANNNITNLEWATRSEQNYHYHANKNRV